MEVAAQVLSATHAARAAALQSFRVNSCIETTRLLVATLTQLHTTARPQPVRAVVHNDAARAAIANRTPLDAWPPRAHTLGVSDVPEPGGWGGHLVCIVRGPSGRLLVDASADQFDRPGRLHVPGPIAVHVPDPWTPYDPACVDVDTDTQVEYAPMAPGHPQYQLWRATPAWNARSPWFTDTAHALGSLIEQGWRWDFRDPASVDALVALLRTLEHPDPVSSGGHQDVNHG